MTTMNADVEPIIAESTTVTLECGMEVEVERLRTRQLMRFMKILTVGAGASLADLGGGGMTEEDFGGRLIGTILFSIPEAEDETVDFVRSMVTPKGLIQTPKSKPEFEVNEGLLARLNEALDNPEIEDLAAILERVYKIEGPHLAALGKRLATLLSLESKSQTAKQYASSKSK